MDYEIAPNGRDFDRRAFIKRAGVVSAATVWAAPTVQSLVAPAFATGTAAGECQACLTGGGATISSSTGNPIIFNGEPIDRISLGQGQICCDGFGPTQIQVNAHVGQGPASSFHFTQNLSLTCTKNGNSPAPPPETADCANVFTGSVEDTNGRTLFFTFIDNGEGGTAAAVDFISIKIVDSSGNTVLEGQGELTAGNLQVHESLGPIKRDCSGC